MAESIAERLADHGGDHDHSYLGSHRAIAACKRELERLGEHLVDSLKMLQAVDGDEKAVVRISPDRCIVQLGPVALTIVWLCNGRDSIAGGELLVIVWRGAVASRSVGAPERPGKQAAASATALWDVVLVPVATDEATWSWQPKAADMPPCSSLELATRCADRLHEAYIASRVTV